MHTGYDNYWMYNRQDSLLNLPKSNFSHSVSLDSYKQVQDGRHTAVPNRFLSPRNNITAKNQNILTNQQRMPQYAWTSPVCAQSTRPNNYQKGFGMQQKDPRLYWDRSGYLNINNNMPQPLNNNMSQKNQAVENNNNSTTQIPRIRVRDVNSLNNIARNSMINSAIQQRQFDRYPNCSYNVSEQQSLPQKGNTEHANYIPSLLEVNPFQPPVQRPTTAPIQPLCQEQFAADTRRTSFSSRNQFQVNNTRRNEAYGNSASLLEELLTFTTNQLDNLQAAEAAQNAQKVNNNLSVPHNAAKDNDLSLLRLLEESCPYRNPPPYGETFTETANTPLTVERSSLPIIEPISPPPVVNDTTISSQPLRITAVISLPDLTNINFNKSISTEKTLPNSTPETAIEPHHTEHDIPAKTVPVHAVNDSLKVKDEPLLNSEISNEMEIVIETIKTENIQEQDENLQKTENKEEKTCSGKKDENANTEMCKNNVTNEIQTEKSMANSQSDETATSESASCYKSEINRDKLDMLIKFLHHDVNGSEYVNEQIYPEKSNSKKPKKVYSISKQKPNMSLSGKSTNGKTDSIPNKFDDIEGARCSPQPSSNVEKDECMKKTQNKFKEQNSKVEKHPEDTLERTKLKNDALKQNSDCKNDQLREKSKSKKDNPKKKVKTLNKSVCTDSQTEKTAKKEGSDIMEKSKTPESGKGKTPADVTQPIKSTEGENSQDKVYSLPSLEENENEKAQDTQTDKEKQTELRMTSPKLPKSPENVKLFQDASQEKDSDGTVRKNPGRIFPNFNYHFCGNCNLVSPIEWFWINAVTGDLKCLNCFKRMNLDSIETNYKLRFSEERDPEANKDIPNSPKVKNTTTGDPDKQTNQKVVDKVNKTSSENQGDKNVNRHCMSKEEPSKEKRKSLDEDLFHDRKEKKRKPDEKSDKKEQTEEANEANVKSKTVPESSKLDRANRKSLSKDGSESPKIEERPRKNSTDQIKKSQSREEEFALKVRKAEGETTKKRRNSKEEFGSKKFRVAEESGEDFAEKFVTEKLKKMKESVQKIKMMEMEEMERRRKTASKEKETTDKETRHGGEKQLKPKENNCHKILRELFEDEPTAKPLKEKQNTKIQSQGFEKLMEKRKKLEKNMKLMKESVERRKRQNGRKNGGIKGPLQYKDFVLNKSAESYFPEVMEGFSLKKIMKDVDVTKKNLKKYNGKNDERCANLFAKLKKKTKTLSLNLLKET